MYEYNEEKKRFTFDYISPFVLIIIKLELSSFYLNTEWNGLFLSVREEEIAIILFQNDEVNPMSYENEF